MPATRISFHPATAGVSRAVFTYVAPSLAVLYVVLAGLWLVPDSLFGMYGNHDGHWASWSVRGMLEWSGFLDFSPFSPLSGTGSLFLPNLPWLNPGALALAIPAPLPLRHLASMLVYLAELTASLYLLYRHLEFSREQSFLATILYICIFFIPLAAYAQAQPWYALAPMNAHVIASMNVATIALIRVGHERLAVALLFGLVFLVALFVAFASAPITSLTYAPAYGLLSIAFLIPCRTQPRAVSRRWGAIAFALLVLALIGVPRYLAATAMTAARGGDAPPIFHPGWRLLSPAYWQRLVSEFPACRIEWQLMCPWTTIGWLEIIALAGAISLVLAGPGAKRRYGVAVIGFLALAHFYALISGDRLLGRLHVLSTPYLMWAFFPLAAPAVIAAGSFLAKPFTKRSIVSSWMPAVAGCLIGIVALLVWFRSVLPYQPRLPGPGPFGLAPIAHLPVNTGPIVDYLRSHIGLEPGSELRGYASTFLGAPDGLVRKTTRTPDDIMTWNAYIAARNILGDRFGNSFQMMDLWNSGIPTLEEYGQSVTRQMYYFNRDLLAEPRDRLDTLPASILLYRFRPILLRGLGVRFVIADGTLADPAIELVMTESGKAEASVNLYQIEHANLGQFSPTRVTWAADYASAIAMLREQPDLATRVVMLGHPERQAALVSASHARLEAVRDGYRLMASAPGAAVLVLPVQFSHCWQAEPLSSAEAPRIFRANIVQTGVLFKDSIDIRLRFAFEPWRASCRLQDAKDLALFGFK